MVTIYGIPNCDTIKKTLDWMKSNKIEFSFHDYRKDPVTKSKLQEWSTQINWQDLLNKKSTTWRGLAPEEQAAAEKKAGAISLLSKHPTLIKRPVIEKNGIAVAVGFDSKTLAEKLA